MGFIMRKKTIINFMILSSLLIVVISLSFSSNVTAVTDSFTENFSSTSYRDFVNSDVSDWGSGEIRISNQEPSELGNYPSSDESLDVAIDGDLAYVPDRTNGVMILNISNSLSPSFVGNYTPTVTSKAEDVCISGDYAYIGYSWAGFHIIDISDPENPTNVYTYNPGDAWGDVEVIGNYAYVISNLGLYVFDVNIYNISNPLSPIVIGDYSGIFGDQIYNTYIVDDTLYCSGGTNGLIVVDVSDPTTPSQYTVADTAGETKAIVVIGGLAYIADGPNGLQILDVSTIYQYNTESTAQSYAVFTGEQETLLRNATLTATDTIVVNTAIDYYLSADNGVNWESITSGVLHTFINQGYQLKWKAVLSTTNIDITPYIDTISIDYISKLNAVSLLNPYNGIVTIDDTPTFEWAELTGISDYLIQIDETDDFLAPVINETVADTTYTVSSALAPKTYYWRVSGIDNGGDTGIFSEARILVIQALVPEFNFISFSVFTLITLSIVFVVVLKRKRS
jgi:hypothetical protein